MFFPFITGKNFAFRIIVEIIFGLWIFLAYRDKTARPRLTYIFWAVMAYFAITTLADTLGIFPGRSLWSNFERMDGWLTLAHLVMFFVILSGMFKTKKIWFYYFLTTCAASVMIGVNGFSQLLGRAAIHQSADRLDATLGNSAYMAVYMLFHIFILAFLYFSAAKKEVWQKVIFAILAVADLVLLYYTQTRGALLGLIGATLVIFGLLAWRGSARIRKISGISIGAVIILIVLFLSIRNTDFVRSQPTLNRLASISLNDNTTKSRFMIWNMSWQGFKDRPVLGWGQENYSAVFSRYYDPGMYAQEPWFDRSHNVVFDNLINAGLLGLLAYLAIFGAAFYHIWRSAGRADGYRESWHSLTGKSIITGLLLAYFFQNLFVFDNPASYALFYSILAFVGTIYSLDDKKADVAVEKRSIGAGDDPYEILVAIVAIVFVIFSVYYFNARSIFVSQELIRGFQLAAGGKNTEVYQSFEKILARSNVIGLTEAREQLIQRTMQVINDQTTATDLKMAFVRLVDTEMAKQFAAFDDDARGHLLYGSYLQSLGRIDESIVQLEKARALAPKKQQILFSLASSYLSKGDNQKAFALAKSAYESDEAYFEAKKIYALVSLFDNQKAVFDQLISGPDRKDILSDQRFITAFQRLKLPIPAI